MVACALARGWGAFAPIFNIKIGVKKCHIQKQIQKQTLPRWNNRF